MKYTTYKKLIEEAIDYEKNEYSWLAYTSGIIHTAMEDDDMLETDISDLIKYRINVYYGGLKR